MTAPQCPLCSLAAMLSEADLPCAKPGKKRKRGKSRSYEGGAASAWAAVSAAVALPVDARMPSGATQAELIGDSTPEEVVRALAIVMGALADLRPVPEAGMRALRCVGLLAAQEVSRGHQ